MSVPTVGRDLGARFAGAGGGREGWGRCATEPQVPPNGEPGFEAPHSNGAVHQAEPPSGRKHPPWEFLILTLLVLLLCVGIILGWTLVGSKSPEKLDAAVAGAVAAACDRAQTQLKALGRAAAELFAEPGRADCRDRRGRRRGQRNRRRGGAAGGDATYVRADVSAWADCQAMVKCATDTYGGLHVLYNNAGIFPADDGGVLDTPESTWEKVMEINLKGVWSWAPGRDPRDDRIGRRQHRQRRTASSR